jgi:cellulose synthase operon protein C
MPSTRRHVLNALHGMATEKPLHRGQVLLAIGTLDATMATEQLRTMTRDEDLDAVARLRCAEALVDLRHDRRETAAVVARAMPHDESVATHVRRHAAGNLTRWSELCRAEARDLIRTLTTDVST